MAIKILDTIHRNKKITSYNDRHCIIEKSVCMLEMNAPFSVMSRTTNSYAEQQQEKRMNKTKHKLHFLSSNKIFHILIDPVD